MKDGALARAGYLGGALSLALAAHCQTTPTAYGEALVVVATDVDVTRFATRLRIDIFDDQLTWLASQDVSVPSAESDWPVSFSVQHAATDGPRTVWVRLRAYRDGNVRDYIGDVGINTTPWREPAVADSLDSLCQEAPVLPLGGTITLRRGPSPLTTTQPSTDATGTPTCTDATASGSVAATVHIREAGSYTFGIAASFPDPRVEKASSLMAQSDQVAGAANLSLRSVCGDVTTQLACADSPLPTFTVSLPAGDYTLVTAGDSATYADLTLHADAAGTFGNLPAATPAPAARQLIVDGKDVTPTTEPTPEAAIDRLIAVTLTPGTRGTEPIVLTGDCFGVPASLPNKTTCVDALHVTEPVTAVTATDPISRTSPSWTPWAGEASVPCSGTPQVDASVFREETCVEGGAFTLGDQLSLGTSAVTLTQPQRVRVVSAFFLDRYEVTVGRWRKALASGFSPDPTDAPTDNPDGPTGGSQCTWSSTPGDAVAEAYPVNCIGWGAARAFCQFEGGDLPSEEQWEYAARQAGREVETQYPWGDAVPDCNRAVLSRATVSSGFMCLPSLPAAVNATPWVTADETTLGIHAMGGGVAEWLTDGLRAYDDPRWESAGLRGAVPFEETAPVRSLRGTGWDGEVVYATSAARRGLPPTDKSDEVGFRCQRSAGH